MSLLRKAFAWHWLTEFFLGAQSAASSAVMYKNPRMQPGAFRPMTHSQPNPYENAFYGAGSGLIRGGLGAYGEKILGSSSEYVQSNVSIAVINIPLLLVACLLSYIWIFFLFIE